MHTFPNLAINNDLPNVHKKNAVKKNEVFEVETSLTLDLVYSFNAVLYHITIFIRH
jgi:hypothetical protein